MTNFEKIKSMSIDEMALFIGGDNAEEDLLCVYCNGKYCEHCEPDGACRASGPDRCMRAAKKWLESDVGK